MESVTADVLVVIPTYNESGNIETVTRAVLAADPRLVVLIVDDSSPDGTGRLAEEMARRDPRVSVLHRPVKEGLGPAYRAGLALGLKSTQARMFITMDADLSHPPDRLPDMLARAEAGADMVCGSRYAPG